MLQAGDVVVNFLNSSLFRIIGRIILRLHLQGVTLVFKFIKVLSVAEDRLFPLSLVSLFKELVEALHYLGVLRVDLDLQLNAQEHSLLMHPLWHPTDSVCFEHVFTFFLDCILFKHQILVCFMSILRFECVFGVL